MHLCKEVLCKSGYLQTPTKRRIKITRMYNNNIKGATWYIMHLVASFFNDAITKHLIKNLPFWQIIFFRLFAGTIMLSLLILFNRKLSFKTSRLFLHMARGGIFFIAISLWCFGLKYCALTSATLIAFTIPIFVLIFAQIFLKEKVNYKSWIATIICFIGIIIISNPANLKFNPYMLYFIISTMLFAILDIINKKSVSKESIITVLLYSSLFASVFTFIPAIKNWISITQNEFLLLIALAIGGNLILYFLLKSFSLVNASFVAPLRYFEVVISTFGGYLLFNEMPDIYTLMGACLIIPATLYISLAKR